MERSILRIPKIFVGLFNMQSRFLRLSTRWLSVDETETSRRKHVMAKGLPKRRELPGVSNVVLIASGKGGVGKSTTAVNIALAMANEESKSVGLLDADIYGPSIPIMMNLSGQPFLDETNKMIPMVNYNVKCMSMGFLIKKPEDALVWRGPMVMGALEKLAHGTNWSGSDVVIVDMPPGTGDIHLSVAQTLAVKGAVVVSTPQKVALADAKKAVSMFKAVNIPVIGCIENMGAFCCPNCNSETRIFGSKNSVKELASELDVPFLGSVPLEAEIMQSSDSGSPIVVSNPRSVSAQTYRNFSVRILDFLKK